MSDTLVAEPVQLSLEQSIGRYVKSSENVREMVGSIAFSEAK
jgi:hypothetical protein